MLYSCYFYSPFCERSYVSEILQIEPHASMPMRGWAVHRVPGAKPGYDSNVCGTPSWLQTPVEAIRPFIFYASVSWLSQCWRRRDTGPTSQKPHWHYSVWIIKRIWRRYLLKGQLFVYFTHCRIKGSVEEDQNTSESTQTQDWYSYNWSRSCRSPGSRMWHLSLLFDWGSMKFRCNQIFYTSAAASFHYDCNESKVHCVVEGFFRPLYLGTVNNCVIPSGAHDRKFRHQDQRSEWDGPADPWVVPVS